MTEEEKIICKQFLNDADKTHSCNKYKLLMALLEQEPTTKNDLEVDVPDNNVGNIDCISREQAKAAIRNRFKDLPSRVEINTILNELPPVTPQEPRKGHWIPVYQGDEIINYRCSECEFGNTFGKGTFGMNFCPRCGSYNGGDNREVEK